jgi:hypothetical protein
MSTPQILSYFSYEHLPEDLQVVSKPFAKLAEAINAGYGDIEEAQVALRKLLEAKDCAVRAAVTARDDS